MRTDPAQSSDAPPPPITVPTSDAVGEKRPRVSSGKLRSLTTPHEPSRTFEKLLQHSKMLCRHLRSFGNVQEASITLSKVLERYRRLRDCKSVVAVAFALTDVHCDLVCRSRRHAGDLPVDEPPERHRCRSSRREEVPANDGGDGKPVAANQAETIERKVVTRANAVEDEVAEAEEERTYCVASICSYRMKDAKPRHGREPLVCFSEKEQRT